VDQEQPNKRPARRLRNQAIEEHVMAFVRVEQRNARLATEVRLSKVEGKDGPLSKGLITTISNVRKGSGEQRAEEATSIQWTLWGKLAENAAQYLGKGSRVNVVGRVQNDTYQNADGQTVYALSFTCEEIDYLDSRMEAEARRARDPSDATPKVAEPGPKSGKANGRARKPAKSAKAVQESVNATPF
jgi:single stranded DNA-binding protein